ncbi:MAG: beta-lactamase family protein [Flavobacteriales bacterium]|nr:beta-lactamase family protein [Flavobacteriales bacterium]
MKWVKSEILWLVIVVVIFSNCDTKPKIKIVETSVQLVDSTTFWQQKYEPYAIEIDKYFAKKHKRTQFYGTVLFAEKGRVIFEKSYGYKKRKTSPEVTLESTFQIASVTKVFTAVAILMLHEQGLIDIDDSVTKYIPELPYDNYNIKISHLLSHTSGLGKYTHFCDNPDGIWVDKDCSITNEDVIKIMESIEPPLSKTPGKRFYYANTNFILLASIIERVTGEKYHDYIAETIFEPLGMESTKAYFRENDAELVNPVKGYESNFREAINIYLNGCEGDKGIYTNVHDMLKFDQALYSEQLLKKETLELAFSGNSKPNKWKHNSNYGYGFRTLELPRTHEKIVYHNGWWRGFRAYFIRRMDKKQTIIILTNVKRGSFLKVIDLVGYLPE